MHKEYQNAASVLSSCNELIDSYSGPKTTQLKAFYLTIQVTHLLTAGQVRELPATALTIIITVCVVDQVSQTSLEASATLCQDA